MTEITGAGNIQSVSGGRFSVDGATMNFEDMVFMVQMQCIEKADEQFATRFDEVKTRNDKISRLNDSIQYMNQFKDVFDGDGKVIDDASLPTGVNRADDHVNLHGSAEWQEFYSEFVQTGLVETTLGVTGTPVTKETLDTLTTNMRAALDNLNSESELDMMKLNKLGNQRGSYVNLATSLLQKVDQARQSAAKM